MLGSNVLSVRLGGIFALQRLAKEYPEEYHVQIMRLFCAFARHPTEDKEYASQLYSSNKFPKTREDVENIVQAVGKRSEFVIELEGKENFRVDFWGVELPGTFLSGMNFTGVRFVRANLTGAIFGNTKLLDAALWDANLSGAVFVLAYNLTQEQLDQPRAESDSPPDLDGVLDAETGKPLVWTGGRGEPLKDDD